MTETSVSRVRALFLFWLVALCAFRLWYGSTRGLVYDEAYYWMWGRKLAPGYYDQGPGVALAVRLGLLFGSSAGAARLAAVLDGIVVSLSAYALGSRIFRTEAAGLCASIFVNILPLLFVGGIMITHDSPQMATWAAALWALSRAMGVGDAAKTSETGRPGYWILTGVLSGMSMDCKFTAVLFWPCLLLLLLLSRRGRAVLRTPWPYAAALCAAIIFIPPVYWNATHDWASVRHITRLGGAKEKQILDTGAIGDYLAGQLLMGLLFMFTMAWAVVQAWRRGRAGDEGLLLAACFSWPIWALFFLLSFHGQVEPNWPVPAYFTAAVVTPWLAWEGMRKAPAGRARALWVFHGLSLALALVAIVLAMFPEVILLLPHGQKIADSYNSKDRTNELYGWGQLARAVEDSGWRAGGHWAVAAARYQDAAELSFALPGQPITYDLPVRRRHNQYDYWPALPNGSDALVVIRAQDRVDLEPQLQQLFKAVEFAREAPLYRRPLYTAPIARYLIFRCQGYRGGPTGIINDEW